MTAAISNRSSILPSVDPEATPEKPVAVPAADGNRIEALKSPAQRASSDAVLKQIDQKMMKGSFQPLRDFWVTEKKAQDCVDLLGQLPPKDYRRALDDMSTSSMSQLMSEMSADTRQAFFKQAQAKGVIVEEPSVPGPRTEGAPPAKPALMRNEKDLPAPLRTAIHAENVERTTQYMKDFDAYVGRYSEAALQASSPLALRMMGPPAREFQLQEGGVMYGDRVVEQTLHQGVSPRARAAKAANDRISDFAGRPRAGSYTATAEAKFAAEAGGFGVESSAELKVSASQLKTKHVNEASAHVLPGVALGITADGQTFTELGTKSKHVRLENGRVTEAEGFGVKLTEDKTTFSMKAAGPYSAFATIDEKHGSYGGGVKAGGELEAMGMKVEGALKLGVTVQGVAPERLELIGCMRDDGIWGPMPELNGTKWNDLPKARRERLASDGWTPGNWPVK